MRNFNQVNLDAHLAELAQNLTPAQALQVKERVREKVAASGWDLSPEAVDGAFNLIGALVSNRLSLPGLGGAGDKLGAVLSVLDVGRLSGGSGLAGQAGEMLGGLVGGIGKAIGDSGNVGSAALGGLSKLLGGAGKSGGDAIGAVGDLVGNAGTVADVVGQVLSAAPDAGDLAGAIIEAIGEALSS